MRRTGCAGWTGSSGARWLREMRGVGGFRGVGVRGVSPAPVLAAVHSLEYRVMTFHRRSSTVKKMLASCQILCS